MVFTISCRVSNCVWCSRSTCHPWESQGYIFHLRIRVLLSLVLFESVFFVSVVIATALSLYMTGSQVPGDCESPFGWWHTSKGSGPGSGWWSSGCPGLYRFLSLENCSHRKTLALPLSRSDCYLIRLWQCLFSYECLDWLIFDCLPGLWGNFWNR